jgi:hypothetical protein
MVLRQDVADASQHAPNSSRIVAARGLGADPAGGLAAARHTPVLPATPVAGCLASGAR